jgi:hypothetical protein
VHLLDNFKVGVVRNLKNQEMVDGMVAINNDSIMCAPSLAVCDYNYSSIDSIKIVFENGMYSKWLKVNVRDYKLIQPVVQTTFQISKYLVFDNVKYLVLKSSIKPVK